MTRRTRLLATAAAALVAPLALALPAVSATRALTRP